MLASFLSLLPTDPWFYVVGFVTTFLVAFGKGAFGGGFAILGVPLMALVVDPIAAAIIVSPLVALMDVFALRAYPPSTWSRPDLRWLVPGLLIGLFTGWMVFELVDKRLVALIIGGVSLAFTLRWFLTKGGAAEERPVEPGKAIGFGAASGFTTFVAHAGGPPLNMYLIPRGLNKTVYAGTTVALFMLGNYLKLIPFGKLGLEQPWTLAGALMLTPVIPFGIRIGKMMHDRISQKTMYLWCYSLVLVASLKLLFDAIRAFL
jgi:uncharacterized protein